MDTSHGTGAGTALADDFLILSVAPGDGAALLGPLQLQCGLAAAVLVDLALAGRLDLDGDVVTVRDATPTGRPLEDAALARVAAEDAHDVRWWVDALRRGTIEAVTARLLTRGVVTEQRQRRLGLLREVRHPLTDPATGEALRARLTAVVEGAADPGGLALLGIAHATGLDATALPGVDAAAVGHRLEDAAADPAARAVTAVVRRVLAAVVTVMAAVTAAM